MNRILPFALPILFLGGCASERDYPSLLPRSAERQTFAEPAAPPPPPVAADPTLDAQIAQATTALAQASKDLDGATAHAEQSAQAARSAPAGSDRWLDAQIALGDLDTARSRQVELLSSLEDMAAKRGGSLVAPYPALDEAIAAAQQAIDAATARIKAIQAQLAPG